jgi:internalin A
MFPEDYRIILSKEGTNLGRLLRAVFGEELSFNMEDAPVVRAKISEVLATLTPREEKVLKMRFGLGSSRTPHTQQQVAIHFVVSRERVGQIERKALRKLRHPTRSKGLKKVVDLLPSPEQVQELDLSELSLTELPEFLLKFPNVRSLILDGNRLQTLPDFTANWKTLNSLFLTRNELTCVPEAVFAFNHLTDLDISANQITEMPAAIGQLGDLRRLWASGNRFTRLPENIGDLVQLEELVLKVNLLNQLPENLGQLTKLRHLKLSHNCLSELPNAIGQLGVLEHLDLADNCLRCLPQSVRNISTLKSLYLAGNEALGLPDSIALRDGWTPDGVSLQQAYWTPPETLIKPLEILEYYFKIAQGSRPLNEAKLILVGRGAVGKTSLVNRLVHGVFKPEKKTEGIKITDWKFTIGSEDDVKLNVWDFGGQEIMHATHQFFLTQSSLYLLVLSGREGGEDADADYWLKLISSFGDRSPVIVVLNKSQEHPFDVNRRALQQKYPFIRDFVKTDCKDGLGIEQLRAIISRETDRLEHLRDPFPASWIAIKDHLTRMRKNFLSFEEYRRKCAKFGERESNGQDVLAIYLHSLGVALNYKDDPRLQDTHILNPHWLTDGIYKILNSKELEKQKGEIRLEDVPSILDQQKYPVAMHRFLFELMKKFELCFTFPDDDTRYLIPELLDKQQPAEAELFSPEDCLNFQYHYPVLPEGLVPRFIVRSHVLSTDQPQWRTGVIAQFEGCRALVKADVQDKKVFISVSGPPSNRRRLLAVIRSDFERIHRDIRSLEPLEMVPLPDYPNVVVNYQKLLALEEQGIWKFPEFVGDRVVECDVEDLLNGVDPELIRASRKPFAAVKPGASVFISYSHKDERLRNELETHLKILQRNGWIDVWHDRRIEAGQDWKNRIDEKLESADIILLLISADFIASDYCYEIEARRALERNFKGQARVIPIILRPCKWQVADFAGLQALPKDGVPVVKWADSDSAWLDIEEGIERVVERLREESKALRQAREAGIVR